MKQFPYVDCSAAARDIPPRILVANGDLDELKAIFITLRDADYAVSVAADGAQIYSRAAAWRPQLIIIDTQLSDAGHTSVTEHLEQTRQTSEIPLLFVANAPDQPGGASPRGYGCVRRPYETEQLLGIVGCYLMNEKSISPFAANMLLHCDATPMQRLLFRAGSRLIENSNAGPVSLSALAHHLATTEPLVRRAFSACAGMTTQTYWRHITMVRAKSLLQETDVSNETIATDLGFQNPATFAIAVFEHFGQTATQLRRSAHANRDR